jgi:hypothetical protein
MNAIVVPTHDVNRNDMRSGSWTSRIKMSFPASDPASTSQPGSVVYERYLELDRLSGTMDDM